MRSSLAAASSTSAMVMYMLEVIAFDAQPTRIVRMTPAKQRARMLLYHYASAGDGQVLAARGHRGAHRDERIVLPAPVADVVLAAPAGVEA